MKPPDEVQRDLVRQWVEKAEQDLTAAEVLLKAGVGLRPVIAFHSQQAAEKLLKAILVRHQVYFAKTHDLGKLLDQLAPYEPATAVALEESVALSPYGV